MFLVNFSFLKSNEAVSILTPAQDPQAIYHGRVWVCANHAIGVQQILHVKNHAGQILQVHLVCHSSLRWNYRNILKNFRTPLSFFQKESKSTALFFSYIYSLEQNYKDKAKTQQKSPCYFPK